MSDLIERLREKAWTGTMHIAAITDEAANALEAMQTRIAELEGDLEVMRLQRDAKLVSETPRNNALKARVEQLEAALREIIDYHDIGGEHVITCQRIAKQALGEPE